MVITLFFYPDCVAKLPQFAISIDWTKHTIHSNSLTHPHPHLHHHPTDPSHIQWPPHAHYKLHTALTHPHTAHSPPHPHTHNGYIENMIFSSKLIQSLHFNKCNFKLYWVSLKANKRKLPRYLFWFIFTPFFFLLYFICKRKVRTIFIIMHLKQIILFGQSVPNWPLIVVRIKTISLDSKLVL